MRPGVNITRLLSLLLCASVHSNKLLSLFSSSGELEQSVYSKISSQSDATIILSASTTQKCFFGCLFTDLLYDSVDILQEYIYRIDSEMWLCCCGGNGDKVFIATEARNFCNSYKHTYFSSPSPAAVANHLTAIMYQRTLAHGTHTCLYITYIIYIYVKQFC
jgi:20S proteasome alpha/beta subunit